MHMAFCQLGLHLADTSDETFSSQFELHGKLALNGIRIASLQG
ncbi:hypothetical protein [Vibrio sp. FF59]